MSTKPDSQNGEARQTGLFAARGWSAPTDLELVGQQLVYQKHPWVGGRKVRTSREMMLAFVALDHDIDILGFARSWGVLELCRHDKPCSHWPALGEWPCVPMAVSGADDTYHEPLEVWRGLAREVRAIRSIAVKLKRGEKRTQDDWAPIRRAGISALALTVARHGRLPDLATHERPILGADTQFDKAVLASVITEWLRDGAVRPQFDSTRLVIQGEGLFGAIAVNLMLDVNGTKRLAICSSCDMPFEQIKAPSRGPRVYCDVCREAGKPHKDAARDSAARIRKTTRQSES